MRNILLTLLIIFSAVAGFSSRTAYAVDPLTCDGYPEARQFVDSQSWWITTPGKSGSNFGHAHMGACLPERETVSDTFTMNVRLIMHNNPGAWNYMSVVLKGTDYEKTITKYYQNGWSCPVGTCERWVEVPIDTSLFNHSGLQEIRFRGFIPEPDGNEMRTNLNFQLYVQNGKSISNVTREPNLRGKGWYTGAGYCEAAFTSVPVPHTVSGIWQPSMDISWHGTTSDLPVTAHDVRLDPDFHNGVPGTILESGSGPFTGIVAIDTTQLTNGPHILHMRADCDDPRGSTNSGVTALRFIVQN